MKINIVKILTIIFITGLLIFLVMVNLSKPRVFILHSYAQDYSWVNDINVGLMRVFEKLPYSFRWHYMDTKRHPSEEYKKKSGDNATSFIKSWKPDILIAIDDNAQQYAAKNFLNHPTMKIIFTGVNATTKKYGYDKADNVTGMLERIPFNAFREVFSQILPESKRRIIHISDASTSSKHIHAELEKVKWKPLKLVKSFQCDTYAEWKKRILEAREIGDVLLITHYHTLKNNIGKIVNPKKVIQWTEPNMKIPGIGCWGFFVEDGGMMAVAVSPYEQGEEVAKMVVKIIKDDEKISNLPVLINKHYIVYIREKSIKSRKLVLPAMLEAFARATNNYFE